MSEETDAIDCWCPKPSPGLQSRENAFGLPTVVPRTPVNLMRECEMAYDDGLVLAALTLVVTVPDVCSRIDGTDSPHLHGLKAARNGGFSFISNGL